MKSWKKPTPEQVDRAVSLLTHAVSYRYFFERLENPEWIEPLRAKGFFQNPSETKLDETRGIINFPSWPESRYLARMASHKPEEVLEIILPIPDTDNVRVYEDFADAALNMPPELAARLVEKAKTWIQLPYQSLLPEKLGDLVVHLAKGGQIEPALELAQALLEASLGIDSSTAERPTEPKPQIELWAYKRFISRKIPELVKAAGIPALELLCDLLDRAIELSRRRPGKRALDDAYTWRPAIEEHPQNLLAYTIEDFMVSGIRDAAEILIQNNIASVSDTVKVLESKNRRIFYRIALHLLRLFSDCASELVSTHLTDRSLFDNASVWHEYAILLRKCFGSLSQEQQQTILSWIKEKPGLWQRRFLALIKEYLSEDWKQYYRSLVKEFGEPEHPEFLSYFKTWVGPTSPKGAEELQKMSVVEIVKFLKTWEPTFEPMSPSPEGLGRELSSVVAKDSNRFAVKAERFKGFDPTYVRAFLSGLRDALKKGQIFDWKPVLKLCHWIVNQPRDKVPKEQWRNFTDEVDPDWGWTRQVIAELLSEGFKETRGAIPFEERETVWEILLPLTYDPDPTPEYERRYGGTNMDPATLSINTTRGEAIHAVIRYALWVRRHLEKLPDGKDRLARGFDEMPEVREVLDAHLDVSKDPSLAIRAVYGQWFPWLVPLDQAWARARVNQIFPEDETLRHFLDAAWETYLAFCGPYDNVFKILRPQYMRAVERLGSLTTEGRRLADPEARLAEHLMAFYWRGKIELEDPMLKQFWDKASDTVRGHAISFIGLSLHKTKEAIPLAIIERLKILWENRLKVVEEEPDKHLAEMAAFGWWFISRKFDDEWAITQLYKSLEIGGRTEPDAQVVECLAQLAPTMSKETLMCLEVLVKGDQEGWRIYMWRKHARRILEVALQSPDVETMTATRNLINYLGSRGYLEFGELLRRQ